MSIKLERLVNKSFNEYTVIEMLHIADNYQM